MIQGLLVILLVIAGLMAKRWYQQQPPQARKKILWRSATGAIVVMLLTLAVTGRMHWLFALIGALLPFLRGILGLGITLLPLWLRRKPKEPTQEQPKRAATGSELTIDEALEILGLTELNKPDITFSTVTEAHRRLIQKVHPDRGGNAYLAARVNRARDILLDALDAGKTL